MNGFSTGNRKQNIWSIVDAEKYRVSLFYIHLSLKLRVNLLMQKKNVLYMTSTHIHVKCVR